MLDAYTTVQFDLNDRFSRTPQGTLALIAEMQCSQLLSDSEFQQMVHPDGVSLSTHCAYLKKREDYAQAGNQPCVHERLQHVYAMKKLMASTMPHRKPLASEVAG